MLALLTVGLFAQLGATLPPDSVTALRDRARAAEARFERLSRQHAPLSWSGGAGYDCDEIVGRFCLRFDSAAQRPARLEDETARVIDARREAVEAARRYFSAAPRALAAAGPLVRLLIRDARAGEAVSAAAAYAVLSGDSLWGSLLQGLAAHAAGAGITAERHFLAGLTRLDDAERREWLDPGWLLDPAEHRRVRRLPAQARTDYERRFWLLADPFWLTRENERWNEHVARRVEARLLSDVPVVLGMVRWGRDLDELTVRYGTPTTRARQAGPAGDGGMVEYWDSAQRAFAPARLSGGPDRAPSPGERPRLYAATARSAYALRTVDRVLDLTHQVTRFLDGDSVLLRVDAVLPLITARPAGGAAETEAGVPDPPDGTSARPRAGLFVYDSAFTRRAGVESTAAVEGDTARFTLFVAARPGSLVYSAEVLGDSTAAAGRARYSLEADIPAAGPIVSDLLVAGPFEVGAIPDRRDDPRIHAFASLVLAAGDTIGLFAEIYRVDPAAAVDIEVSIEAADRPSAPERFARWIGRGLGLVSPVDEPRVGWRAEAGPDGRVVALNVPLPPDRRGSHDLVIVVVDPSTGGKTEARRRILLR